MSEHKYPSDEEEKELFKGLQPPYKKSKEAVWAELAAQLEKPTAKIVSLKKFRWIAVAASVLLLVGAFSLLNRTTSISTAAGSHLVAQLPDGSTVELNAATTISYKPYAWYFNRQVSLEGEAFFKVKKGSDFTVKSTLGKTTVLGTEFNVYARNQEYKVFCREGKVRVESNKKQVLLLAGDRAELRAQSFKKDSGIEEQKILAWQQDKFFFEAQALDLVLQELERQYNVELTLDLPREKIKLYTGNFDKKIGIEATLELICLSFNLQFEKISDRQYKITQ